MLRSRLGRFFGIPEKIGFFSKLVFRFRGKSKTEKPKKPKTRKKYEKPEKIREIKGKKAQTPLISNPQITLDSSCMPSSVTAGTI